MTESVCGSLCAHVHQPVDVQLSVYSCSSRVTTAQPVSAYADQYYLVSCIELRLVVAWMLPMWFSSCSICHL